MLRIRQSSQALRDIVEISLFIANDNLSAADALVDNIDRKLKTLAQFPDLGESRPELGEGIRCFIAGSYVLIYRAAGEELQLVRVIHASRDIDALF